MSKAIWKAMDIRYVDVRFDVSFRTDVILPEYKVSALRGGMGQILLSRYCRGDRRCEECLSEEACTVRQMMYSKYEIQPGFAGEGDSNGYVIECENHQIVFLAGDRLSFRLLLYGKLIAFFPEFAKAFELLGYVGLGKDKAQYDIIQMIDSEGYQLLRSYGFDRPMVRNLRDYAGDRVRALKEGGIKNRLLFLSPVEIKHGKQFIRSFDTLPILSSLYRRIYCMDCYIGKDLPKLIWDGRMPVVVQQRAEPVFVNRYSETQHRKMILRGIQGMVEFDDIEDELLHVFAAGEILHIGKNTSFGFGKYVVM